MLNTLPPEIEILIAACSVGDNSPAPPRTGIDAKRLLRLALFHRVAPLVYEHRREIGLPLDCEDSFRAATLASLHRNLQFAAELTIALNVLHSAGVPVILLKGAHLMDAVYHNPALRPMSDLDILVHPADAATAVHALMGEGYMVDAKKAAFGLAADREIRLDKSGVHDLVIELHTDLNRPTRHHWFPMDAIWQRSQEYAVGGAPARTLSDADNLTFLCAHAIPHAFSQLIWLRDIAGLLPVAPAGIRTSAEVAHARRAVYAGLWLSATVLGASVDDELLQSLEGNDAPALQSALSRERLFGGTHYSTIDSLKFRALLADTAADSASIIGAGAVRKIDEYRRGLSTRKQK
jgi:hypothetical protein